MEPGRPAALAELVAAYDARRPRGTADALRALWLQAEPRSVAGIRAELREQQETIGTPVPLLKELGAAVGRAARGRVADFLPLARLLWDEYGREGRVVALLALGAMELAAPETIIPLLRELARGCLTWEDADRLAMDALEPIVRKSPQAWLGAIERWLADESPWVRRAAVTVACRLPMKHAAYAGRCALLAERLLGDPDPDVRRALSFALRLTARGDVAPVLGLLRRHVAAAALAAASAAAVWVLCDVIHSMGKQLLPAFLPLLPLYAAWAAAPGLRVQDRRSIESAVKTLREAGPG